MTARLAAGALGPSSTFGARRSQKVRSAGAIIAACKAVLEEDGMRPSIANVLAEGGFSETTLHRARYKPILAAAKRRFDARAAGEWAEGDEDDLARMDEMVAKEHWVTPASPADFKEDPGDGRQDDGSSFEGEGERDGGGAHETGVDDDAGDSADAEAGAGEDGGEVSDVPGPVALDDFAELNARILRLEAEVARRDDQLYHAVQTAQRWSRTIRLLRETIRELRSEIDTLQIEPWDPRDTGDWANAPDEAWPENE